MNLAGALTAVNWLAIIVSTIAAFSLGGLWYSQAMFGGAWMQEVGLTEQSMTKANLRPILAGTALLQLVSATALAVFLGPGSTWLIGLQSGLIIGICWLATAYGITCLFEQRSFRLFRINAGYYVAVFTIMATIIGAWH